MITFDTNLKANSATTQYLNFEYNSMVKFGNLFLCASENGLFQVTGEADNGVDVEHYFEPVTMDFGISNEKRLRAVYIGYEAAGNINLIISTEAGLSDSYVLPASTPGQHARKVVVSRKLRGRYWTFQINSVGIYFAIDKIDVLPIVRSHGVNKN